MRLLDRVLNVIRTQGLIPAGSRLVVGVSGGTDSLTLLHLLADLRQPLALDLHVATLDHGLRGEAGAADARFVVDLAEAWNIPVTAGYVEVSTLAQERGLGIEAAARTARYDFLAAVAHEVDADRAAVAHQADDQVETVLLHLLRGSSLAGLVGMTYSTSLPGHADLTLIRPLLGVARADLEAYCREHNLQPRQDASNEDTHYTRNRLRREAIPYLRQLSPQIERRLTQLAEIAALEDDLADSTLHQAIAPHLIRSEARISLPNGLFFNLHPALQRRFIVWAVRQLNDGQEVDYRRVSAALEMAVRGKVGARTQFRGGVQFRTARRDVIVERATEAFGADEPLLSAPGEVVSINLPGVIRLDGGWLLEASLLPLADTAVRLAAPEGSVLSLRGRRTGDRFAPLGLSGHTQKLSKWMIDHKVPQPLRDRLPLVALDDQIAAIYWRGWFVSELFRVTASSTQIIMLQFSNFS